VHQVGFFFLLEYTTFRKSNVFIFRGQLDPVTRCHIPQECIAEVRRSENPKFALLFLFMCHLRYSIHIFVSPATISDQRINCQGVRPSEHIEAVEKQGESSSNAVFRGSLNRGSRPHL